MKIERINNINSNKFHEAVELGDQNSKTLGFLPKIAFEKYAKQNQLIGAIDKKKDTVLGYLLYRTSYNRVTIVHLCIDPNIRNKGVADKLVTELKSTTKQYDGIRLSCRNDYGIDKVWEKFNFVPVKEKIGRSHKKLPLTIWWFPHYQNNFLSQITEYELKNKIVAVIDMNIFLDIKDERNVESLALKSDWILSETILYYTREIHNEINRANNNKEKEKSRNLLSYYKELPFKNENDFETVLKEIEAIKISGRNSKSDKRHLAYSIIGEAQFFITRDEGILRNKELLKKYGLNVYRPSEFITHLDENIQTSKYKPQRLIGTSINSTRINSENANFFISTFLKSNEKKTYLQKTIRTCLSFPNKYEIVSILKNEKLLALVIYDKTDKNKLKIPVFRFLKSELKETLAKHILYKAIFKATIEHSNIIEITENILDTDLTQIIQETRFISVNGVWKKINLNSVIKQNEIINLINAKLNENKTDAFSILDKIKTKSELLSKYNVERYFSPLKISDLNIPTFIVPIRPHWSERLFNDKSEQILPLFEPDYELLLNRENVYYRSSKPKILNAPARILWYESENKTTKTSGKIVASSYIDNVFIDNPKKLFKQFEQLGVYEWKHIQKTANKKDEIMAFVFSDTELFNNLISLRKINLLFKNYEKVNFLPIAPVKIKNETYIAIYKLGKQLYNE